MKALINEPKKKNGQKTKLQALLAKISRAEIESKLNVECIRNDFDRELWKKFDASKKLQKDIEALNNSTEYGSDEIGIYQWIRMSYTLPDELQNDTEGHDSLDRYMAEQWLHYDRDSNALFLYQGETIVINKDGDIFLVDQPGSGEVIIGHDEYKDEEKRNKLIEKWMEDQGYFPGVFTEDNYGNVFHVKTQIKVNK